MDKTSSITVVEYIVVGCKNMEKKARKICTREEKIESRQPHKKGKEGQKNNSRNSARSEKQINRNNQQIGNQKKKKKVDEKQVDS